MNNSNNKKTILEERLGALSQTARRTAQHSGEQTRDVRGTIA